MKNQDDQEHRYHEQILLYQQEIDEERDKNYSLDIQLK